MPSLASARAVHAKPGAGDHQIARRQILEGVVGDPGHRLVLAVDARDAGKALGLLRCAGRSSNRLMGSE